MRARVLVCLLALGGGLLTGVAPAGAQTGNGTLSGTVTDEQGEPVEGVCVEVFGAEFEYLTTETVEDGTWSVSVVTPDEYVVGFGTCGGSAPGFSPEWYDDARSQEDATLVPVDTGQAVTGIDAVLAPSGSFSGTVVDDDTGEPLEEICVVAFESTTGAFGQTLTAADGSYLVEDLPAGDYMVIFGDCAEPFTYITEFYDDVAVVADQPETDPTPVTVASGEDTGGIDAGLAEGGAVEGTLTGLHTAQGQPLVCVGLYDADAQADDVPVALSFSGLVPAPTTDLADVPPGRFVLGGLAPGDYVLATNPVFCEDDGYTTTWYDAEEERAEATVLTVVQGEVLTGVDSTVVPLPSISFACPFEIDPSEAPFSDVPEGNVHRQAIECLQLFGVVAGRGDGTYGPAVPVSRAQLASFVARTLEAAGLELPENAPNAFDDDNGDIHERAIDQLAALGVVAGKGGRRYAPAESVNRGQMATFLVNAYERATEVTLQAPTDRFGDDAGNVHEVAINKVATAGITAGTGSGYAPFAVVRRDQMASFLARLLDRVQRDQALTFGTDTEPAPGQGEGVMSRSWISPAPAPAGEPVTTLSTLVRGAAGR